jgi:hypothetical protein
MKQLLLVIALLTTTITIAQNKLLFEYDAAGNQIKRSLCINCPTTTGKTIENIAEIKQEDLQKFSPSDIISFYPNPVKEELYLKWDMVDNASVKTVNIYSLQGQEIKSYNTLENTNSLIVPFQAMPNAVYTIILGYSNGEQKSIKIIKQ